MFRLFHKAVTRYEYEKCKRGELFICTSINSLKTLKSNSYNFLVK
jgi:hypothetical protein